VSGQFDGLERECSFAGQEPQGEQAFRSDGQGFEGHVGVEETQTEQRREQLPAETSALLLSAGEVFGNHQLLSQKKRRQRIVWVGRLDEVGAAFAKVEGDGAVGERE
jgi:hypothetical protein